MSTAEQPDFVTVEQYLAAEEKAVSKSDYIDGWVRAMPGATIRHNSIVGNSFAFMHSLLKGKPCKPYNSDTKLRIRSQDSEGVDPKIELPFLERVMQMSNIYDGIEFTPMTVQEMQAEYERSTGPASLSGCLNCGKSFGTTG